MEIKEIWRSDTLIRQNRLENTVRRDKEGHYTMIEELIQEDITIVNKYAPDARAPQYTGNCLKEKSIGTRTMKK